MKLTYISNSASKIKARWKFFEKQNKVHSTMKLSLTILVVCFTTCPGFFETSSRKKKKKKKEPGRKTKR